MAPIAPRVLRRYLLGGRIPAGGCLNRVKTSPQSAAFSSATKRYHEAQISHPSPIAEPSPIPFRKQLKDEAKRRRAEGTNKVSKQDNQKLEDWELTVGIEIHAQLNTTRKLFSGASSTINDVPNTHVALFDVAMPGSLPKFQPETLIPAIRAALALDCTVQRKSKFDRKHYFHWDQPSGYQITQYYEPFAKDGHIKLYAHDGIAKEDGEEITIGIKQIQMEQDTAKTISEPGDIHLLDFNRVGLPLIEIITLPEIHHPSTAAALVRKVQIILDSVDACVLGMQSGGLRADVNVSVRRRDGSEGGHEYAGVKGLGQRTEIKNLSSFKAVEDAIIAERDRQIELIKSGGVIEGETRGWTIGGTGTKRLRGKEGEVDYRYMPDPDLGPVLIDQTVIRRLKKGLGRLPDEVINLLTTRFGLTVKDAMTLVSLNDGGRYEYFCDVHAAVTLLKTEDPRFDFEADKEIISRQCANWVLHEIGGLTHHLADEENPLGITSTGECIISADNLALLINYLDKKQITARSAKKVLQELFAKGIAGQPTTTSSEIEEAGLWFTPLSSDNYEGLARSVLDMKVVEEILAGKEGKVNFLLGKMMRKDADGRVDPQVATAALKRIIEGYRK
ncbi:glutamyl-tRNA amidotransferas-like protein subunit B [Amylocarpus encephaloides]|uniref:Glutamyl-tRNA(Gln) amidotransferase subunit B, mitochondrial n=1 Tax=Amylocarpus encephaloides TaxID=45428 RepID=A0A9P8C675_9HELO|nr:glutamyl-tRNA amidotransferas-like protein subunit B [Amylocarpus encephaloides]